MKLKPDPKEQALASLALSRRGDGMNDRVPNDWLEGIAITVALFAIAGGLYFLWTLEQAAQ